MVVKVTGIYWLDSVIAILVSLLLFWTGFGLVKESVSGLLDAEDENVLQAIQNVFDDKKGNGIIQVHHVKVIRAGNYHHIDAHMVIAEFWDIKTVHEKVKKFEDDFLKSYKWQGEMNFHFDPCRRVYCRQCDLVECPIRIEKFVRQIPLSLEEMRSVEEPDLI
jgi:divalent metal cation (Fe/Co/Zn/Cd) transporter